MGKRKTTPAESSRKTHAVNPSESTAVAMVQEAWARLEIWSRQNVPGLLGVLNIGATSSEIVALEHTIKRSLPEDVRKSLSIHNGQHRQQLTGFVFNLDLLDTVRIAEEWEIWAGLTDYNSEHRTDMVSFPSEAIELDYANSGWIPVTKSASGSFIAVDLVPGPAGSAGQVVNFGREEKLKCVLAASWGEFLLSYAKFLESGILKEIHQEPKFWGDNFESIFEAAADDRHQRIKRPSTC